MFSTVDGVLTIRVSQRDAIMRVYNTDGSSNYIDSEGYIIPSTRYAANVIVVNGNISIRANGKVGEFVFSETLPTQPIVKVCSTSLYNLCYYIRNDKFWGSQIVQVYINSEKDVDLVTRVGNHTVKMGSLEGYENKLNKLYAFYKNALPLEGWNKYSVINLKYGNQVICKK